MKLTIVTILTFCLFVEKNFSEESSRRREAISSYDQPDGSLEAESADEDCDPELSVEDQIHESFKALWLVGDRDLDFSETRRGHREHCRNLEKHLDQYTKHVKCVDKKHRQFLEMLSLGFGRSVQNRCYSATYQKNYRKHSKCLKNNEVQDKFHSCSDRGFVALSYVLQRVPKKTQLKLVCCFMAFINECIHEEIDKICGSQTADFVMNTVYDPFRDEGKYFCENKFEQWCDRQPRSLETFERIFSRKAPRQTEGFQRLLLKIIENYFED